MYANSEVILGHHGGYHLRLSYSPHDVPSGTVYGVLPKNLCNVPTEYCRHDHAKPQKIKLLEPEHTNGRVDWSSTPRQRTLGASGPLSMMPRC